MSKCGVFRQSWKEYPGFRRANSSLSIVGPNLGMAVLSVNEPSTIILTAIFQSNADSCTGTVVDSTWRA